MASSTSGKGGQIQSQQQLPPGAAVSRRNPMEPGNSAVTQQPRQVAQQQPQQMQQTPNPSQPALNPYVQASGGLADMFDYYTRAGAGGANLVQPAQTIQSQMGRYTNPYTENVINRTTQGMRRDMNEQLVDVAGDAAQAGAFGGARHGLVEGAVRADANRQIGDMAAGLRQQGFDTAAGLAGQDISNRMSQQQFNAGQRDTYRDRLMGVGSAMGSGAQAAYGIGNDITDRQMQQGSMVQALQQAIMGSAQDMFGQYAGQPDRLLQLRLQSLGVNPMNNATSTTTTTNPGWGAMFGNLLGAAGNAVQFSPIQLSWSSRRFKHSIVRTGEKARSQDGKVVDVVTFKYHEALDPQQYTHKGVIAEELGAGDSAVLLDDLRQPVAVDYSKLEII